MFIHCTAVDRITYEGHYSDEISNEWSTATRFRTGGTSSSDTFFLHATRPALFACSNCPSGSHQRPRPLPAQISSLRLSPQLLPAHKRTNPQPIGTFSLLRICNGSICRVYHDVPCFDNHLWNESSSSSLDLSINMISYLTNAQRIGIPRTSLADAGRWNLLVMHEMNARGPGQNHVPSAACGSRGL